MPPEHGDEHARSSAQLAADRRARRDRDLAALIAAIALPADPRPGVALGLWRGDRRSRFLLANPRAHYDPCHDLYWPETLDGFLLWTEHGRDGDRGERPA